MLVQRVPHNSREAITVGVWKRKDVRAYTWERFECEYWFNLIIKCSSDQPIVLPAASFEYVLCNVLIQKDVVFNK